MASLPDLIQRARLEMGDAARPFDDQHQGDGVLTRVDTSRKPLNTTGLVLKVTSGSGTTTLSSPADYTVDADNGRVTLAAPLAVGSVLSIDGTAYSYFTDTDWTTFFTTSLDQHLHNRADEMGQPVELATLPSVEEYPVVLLAITQALYALLNDASFDVDIHTPEGVSIPRGQRVEQLWHMLSGRIDQYNKLCSALNVGLYRIEQFDLRRKSYQTGRLVPIYEAQEIQDSRFPRQIFPEIPTDGAPLEPVVQFEQRIDLTGYSNQDFTYTVNLNEDITGLTVRAAVRRYPYNLTPLVYMTVEVLDAATGQVRVSVNGRLMYYVGMSKFWDLQTIDSNGSLTTRVGGTFDAIRQGGPWP